MESNGKEAKNEPLIGSLKTEKDGEEEKFLVKEEDDESKRLLSPKGDEVSKGVSKVKRKVQWNDTNGGNKLAEVLEFLPSDVSDNDDDEDSDYCFCTIM